jgi:spore germination cell wall hydrolase CwlJ-like protein
MIKYILTVLVNICIIISMIVIYQTETAKNIAEAKANSELITRQIDQIMLEQDIHCLALNIYFEARGDSVTGQRAVAWVTLNRVKSADFPNTVCEVVYQAKLDKAGKPKLNQCQFSWFCDGKADKPIDEELWQQAKSIAEYIIRRYQYDTDPTEGATFYHADYVKPSWSRSFERTVRIDNHIFYK